MFAKWPLTDMTEGAVGCLMLFEGRLSLRSRCGEATAAILVEYWYTKRMYVRNQKAAKQARDVAAWW